MNAAAEISTSTPWVITISRQMGSLGDEIAERVAELLQFRLVEREVINRAARRAGAPEAALANIDELGLLGLKPSEDECHAYNFAVRQVVEELAHEGRVVIVGRGGQVILAGWPQVRRVRIIAPLGLRAERIAAHQGISLSAAQAQIRASDRARAAYLKRCYQERADNLDLYDLVLNTQSLSLQEAALAICQSLSDQVFQPVPSQP